MALSADMSAAATPFGPEACTAMKVRRLARRVTQIYDAALAPHGLTIGQMGLLAALRRREGVSITTLADRLSVDASTLSRLLRPLLSAGLIVLESDPDDARVRRVRLTESGFDRRAAATPAWAAAQESLDASLGAGRVAALRFLLDDAHDHLRETVK